MMNVEIVLEVIHAVVAIFATTFMFWLGRRSMAKKLEEEREAVKRLTTPREPSELGPYRETVVVHHDHDGTVDQVACTARIMELQANIKRLEANLDEKLRELRMTNKAMRDGYYLTGGPSRPRPGSAYRPQPTSLPSKGSVVWK